MPKSKNINFDAYYVFNYNQQYRLENMNYYREYAKAYNLKHKDQLNEYRRFYYERQKYMKKNKDPIIEYIEGPVRLLFS